MPQYKYLSRSQAKDPNAYRIRTKVFSPALWDRYGITSLTDLAERMHVTTGALSKLQHDRSREPSASIIRGALCAFPGNTITDLFYLERTDAR